MVLGTAPRTLTATDHLWPGSLIATGHTDNGSQGRVALVLSAPRESAGSAASDAEKQPANPFFRYLWQGGEIALNAEHTRYAWTAPGALAGMDVMDGVRADLAYFGLLQG